MTDRIIDLTTNSRTTLESAILRRAIIALIFADDDDQGDSVAAAWIEFEAAAIEAGFMSTDNAIESADMNLIDGIWEARIAFEYGAPMVIKIKVKA